MRRRCVLAPWRKAAAESPAATADKWARCRRQSRTLVGGERQEAGGGAEAGDALHDLADQGPVIAPLVDGLVAQPAGQVGAHHVDAPRQDAERRRPRHVQPKLLHRSMRTLAFAPTDADHR